MNLSAKPSSIFLIARDGMWSFECGKNKEGTAEGASEIYYSAGGRLQCFIAHQENL